MKLRYSPTSPYVRKVEVAAHEIGLFDRIERIGTNPWDPASDIGKENPLHKVPALSIDEGEVLFDSTLICEYLDSLNDGEKLFPEAGERRWRTLKLYMAADGILDASVLRIIERTRRPKELFWADWDAWQSDKIVRALDFLESQIEKLEARLTIASVTTGCALGYLDFRFGEEDWRADHTHLAAWYAAFAERPSMQATFPKAPS